MCDTCVCAYNACGVSGVREGMGVGKGECIVPPSPHIQTSATLFCQRKVSIHRKRLKLVFFSLVCLYELPVKTLIIAAVLYNFELVYKNRAPFFHFVSFILIHMFRVKATALKKFEES